MAGTHSRWSLYGLLGAIIVAVVVAVLGSHAVYTYLSQQRQMTEAMKESAALSIATLQQNIDSYIASYAANEYAQLVATEVELRRHFAIVVEDFNMGRILGQPAYLSGKIRTPSGAIVDFDPEDPAHREWLQQCFYSQSAAIVSPAGTRLGTVTVYVSDQRMREELDRILSRTVTDTLSISLLLVALLLLAIGRLVFRPLSQIAGIIRRTDADGIPSVAVPDYGYRELSRLTDTMNAMLQLIRRSRASLQAEHEALLERNARDAALNQSLPAGVLVYDNDLTTVVFANASAARVFETDAQRLVGSDLRQMAWRVVREDGSAEPAGLVPLRPGKRQQHLLRGLDFGGRVKWLSINSEPFYVEGALAGAIVSFMDVSREREVIRELDAERERFQLAIEGSQDGLWDWDPNTDRVFFSRQWKCMLGFDEDEIGDTLEEWSSRVHPDDLVAAMAAVGAHLRGETEVYEDRHRMRCKDGSWKWILDRGKALFDAQGRPVRVVGFHTDITQEMRHREELAHSAKHDALTHLPNRFLFNELIQNLMHRCKRNGSLLALLYVDLDGFKEINDAHGHETGDRVLVVTARRMQELLRQGDVVARLGGDEFVVAVADLERQEDLLPLLQRLLHDLALPIPHPSTEAEKLNVAASVGVTFYPQGEELGPEALLRQADQAMYEAKHAGKNRYRFFDVKTESAYRERLRLVEEVQRAIDQDEFRLHYQPKVDMADGSVVGFEALLRWAPPEGGLRYPDQFLPKLHQEKALMLALGQWVFRHALAQLTRWVEAGHDFTLSVNVSAHEFKESRWIVTLEELLKQYPKVKPERVELEILETNALDDTQEAKEMILACQRLGLTVALDDFGTGYSTLGYLKELPVDTLKIDKGFVMEMPYDGGSLSILEASIGLAEAFRCNIVAEGVEDVEHGVILLQLGCRIAQGYAIAKPMPAEEVLEWVRGYRTEPRWQATSRLYYEDRNLLYAAIEHRSWLKGLQRYLTDPAGYQPPELDPEQCRFGTWLGEEAAQHFGPDSLRRIQRLHGELHGMAEALIAGTPNGSIDDVVALHEQILGSLEALAKPMSGDDR